MAESIKSFSISKAEIDRRVKLINPELMNQLADENRSVVHLLGHHANWEWFAFAFSIHLKHQLFFIYKPLSRSSFEAAYKQFRERFGAITVTMKKTFKVIEAWEGKPYATYFGSDQSPQPHNDYLWTSFMGRETAVYLGAEVIARQTNAAVVFGKMRRKKRGFYEIEWELITLDPKQEALYSITEKHTRVLEALIKEDPSLWIWSHKRWKFENKHNERVHLRKPMA